MKAAYHPEEVVATVQSARWQYVAIFLGVLSVTYGFFVAIDFVPEKPEENIAATSSSTSRVTEVAHAANGEIAADMTTTTTSLSATAAATDTTMTAEAASDESGEGDTQPQSAPADASEEVVVVDNSTTDSSMESASALPVRIEIDALDRVVPVLNPTSRNVADLDEALLSGVVRHPDAANFYQDGNMFILGHSSRLPNVINQNFQAFNDIETLQWGDTIRVYSTDRVYVYRVEKTYEAKASTASVPIAGTGKMLTLATCDSFGSVDDRYIVEAKLVSQQAL